MTSVSLLVPCYNAASYLPQLWEQLAQLTRAFDEIICFDDGSTDETASVAEGLGATVIRSTENHGPGYARNRCAEQSRCEWLHFHDADDRIDPSYLDLMLEKVSAESDVVICNADWVREDTDAVLIARRYSEAIFSKEPLPETISNPIGIISAMCRRSLFEKVGGFREDIRCWEDGDLFVRLAAEGARFQIVDKVLAWSVRHERGVSRDQLYCAHCRLKLLRDYFESYGDAVQGVVAEELVAVAAEFARSSDWAGLRQAFSFADALGQDLLQTKNPLLKSLRFFLPRTTVFSLQVRGRDRARRS